MYKNTSLLARANPRQEAHVKDSIPQFNLTVAARVRTPQSATLQQTRDRAKRTLHIRGIVYKWNENRI